MKGLSSVHGLGLPCTAGTSGCNLAPRVAVLCPEEALALVPLAVSFPKTVYSFRGHCIHPYTEITGWKGKGTFDMSSEFHQVYQKRFQAAASFTPASNKHPTTLRTQPRRYQHGLSLGAGTGPLGSQRTLGKWQPRDSLVS